MKTISKFYNHIANDSLYRNSIFLMLSTGVMAFFGFFFWMINARLFTTEQIGLATTLTSVMGLITSFSLLGLNTGLIRYLPKSERKNDKINTCFSVVILITAIVSIVFLLNLKTFSPKLLFVKENPFYALLFILFIIVSSLSNVLESIFIAFRNTKFVFIQNTIYSILKVVFPVFFVTLGVFGIFSSWMVALTIGIGFSFIILVRKFDYKPKLVINKSIIEKIGRFSFGNYIAGFLGSLPSMVLPLVITNKIGPETTAHYYMAMMIASLLFVIPQAATQSLFAEGSHDEKELKQHVKKATKIIALILIPGILATVFLGKYILLAFGKDYSNGGLQFLQLLAISGIFVSINGILGTILRIGHRIKELILISFINTVIILGLSYLLTSLGLLGIGVAWIIGYVVMAVLNLLFYFSYKYKNRRCCKSSFC